MTHRSTIKALIDACFPFVPSSRRSSKMINDTLTAINDGYCDDLDALATLVAAKLSAPNGTTAQYIRGDGSVANFPSIPAGVDVSGKSDKANFAAVAALVVHGRSNVATNNPTDSKTDYNVLTTLLGAVTDGLNQTNTKQNTIATNLNALSAQFNALLTWLTTNQATVNNIRLAGAA